MGGGENNTGIDSDNNYVFNVKQMTARGSFRGDDVFDAEKAIKNGELKMLLSLSKDTQNYAFEVDIDTDGNAIILKDSEIGKMLFGEENGKAVFKGKFAEVAKIIEGEGDEDAVDKVRLLATHVGKNNVEVPEINTTPIPIPENYVTNFNILADKEVDLPPIIPIFGRLPLEPTIKEERKGPSPLPEPGPKALPGQKEVKALTERPSSNLETTNWVQGEIVKEDRIAIRKEDGRGLQEPIQNRIEKYFVYLKEHDPEYFAKLEKVFNKGSQEQIQSKTEGVIILPFNETTTAENVKYSLEAYAKQLDENGESIWSGEESPYEMVIYLQGANQKALSAIRSFTKRHPEMSIIMYKGALESRRAVAELPLMLQQQRGEGEIFGVVGNTNVEQAIALPEFLHDDLVEHREVKSAKSQEKENKEKEKRKQEEEANQKNAQKQAREEIIKELGTLEEFASEQKIEDELLKEALGDELNKYAGKDKLRAAEAELKMFQQIAMEFTMPEESAGMLLKEGYRKGDFKERRQWFVFGPKRIYDKKGEKDYSRDEFDTFLSGKVGEYDKEAENKQKKLKEEWYSEYDKAYEKLLDNS